MDEFRFPAILANPCFPGKAAALRYWVRHQWRGLRLRLEQDPGCLFDLLSPALIVVAALLF
jgi:hypothetical protein